MTPFLIFLGVPPAYAVANEANNILATSVSGSTTHYLKNTLDYKMGIMIVIGGSIGTALGIYTFTYFKGIGKIDNSLIKNQEKNVFTKAFINEAQKISQDKSKISFSEKTYNNSFQVKALTSPSPSLDQTKYLINTWLYKKADFLARKSEIDISKIVQTNLIRRLTKERQDDIQKRQKMQKISKF